jgi:dTDP-4-amino-4,6-dideoxygalactose transaminase
MIGYNFRLGEIECAIGIAQLDKLQGLVKRRQAIAQQFDAGLADLPGLITPRIRQDCTHAYYVYPLVLDTLKLGLPRQTLIDALKAEGITGLAGGYQNIHLLPMFQKKIAFGSKGFPWNSDVCLREVSYAHGICPVAERLHEQTYLGFSMCVHDLNDEDIGLIISAFRKVWQKLDALRDVRTSA